MQVLPAPHGEFMGPLQKQSQLSAPQLSGYGKHMRISGWPDMANVRTQYCRSATHMSEPQENETEPDPLEPPRAPLVPPFGPPPLGFTPPLPALVPPSPAAPPGVEPAPPPGVPPAPLPP